MLVQVYVAPVGVLRGYLIDSPYSASTALRRSVSLTATESPYLSSAYRKPVYVYFTSIEGVTSSASTSAVRRYAVSEYGDAYSQYTASNRAFKFEAVERPADWFFRVSPVRRFYEYLQPLDWLTLVKAIGATVGVYENATSEYRALLASRTYGTYEKLYDKLVYSKTVSPLLASQILAYRPRRRYASYAVSDYSQLYSLLNYIKAVLFRVADLENLYGVPLYKKLSYSFSSIEDILAVALGVKPVYVLLTDVEPVFDSFAYKLVSIAHSDYEDLYTLILEVKPVSSYHVDIESVADLASYRLASKAYNTYERLYERPVYSKTVSPLLTLQLLAYRPRRRYASYPSVDYSEVYSVVSYIKAVFARYSDVGGLYDRFAAVPVAKAYLAYEKPYEAVRYVKTLSPAVFTVFGYRPRRRYAAYSATGYERTYDGVRAVKAVVVRLGSVVDVYAVSKLVNRSAAFAEFVVPYESFEARPVYVYQADSYEVLYIFNYMPTVRYYNVYFVNVYRYANISDLERLYESFRYEKKSAGYSYTSYELVYEGLGYGRSGYGYASYEGLYEGFIAQKG